jgi:hypothetical protein
MLGTHKSAEVIAAGVAAATLDYGVVQARGMCLGINDAENLQFRR